MTPLYNFLPTLMEQNPTCFAFYFTTTDAIDYATIYYPPSPPTSLCSLPRGIITEAFANLQLFNANSSQYPSIYKGKWSLPYSDPLGMAAIADRITFLLGNGHHVIMVL